MACSSCGAPLHDLKMLRKDKSGDRELVQPSRVRSAKPKPVKYSKPKKYKKKKRKSLFKSVFEEAFDVLEDIFD